MSKKYWLKKALKYLAIVAGSFISVLIVLASSLAIYIQFGVEDDDAANQMVSSIAFISSFVIVALTACLITYFLQTGRQKKFDAFLNEIGKGNFDADCYDVVGIPLSSITEIVEVEENLLLPNWHKKEDYKSNEYKEYNIHKTIKGIVIPSYIKVILNINNCAYYFSVPNYEADKLRKLINK